MSIYSSLEKLAEINLDQSPHRVINPVRLNAQKQGLIYPSEPVDFYETHPRTVMINGVKFVYIDSGEVGKEYITHVNGNTFSAGRIQSWRDKWNDVVLFCANDFAIAHESMLYA